ncbi:MAG: hypothetical protein E6I52_24925 [Chloroflexi bacterium]|nr:MAG: hypothetical protein E6I52_24925 [Chloroflexota bacterium]
MTEVTFFMIVTPRDVVIADYAVRSYGRIHDLDFKLAVYSNYLLPEQKAYYFPRWDALPFVELVRNPHHDADLLNIGGRINAERLEGPFEYCDPIWDRELRKHVTPFVATVDADFEILRPRFLACMMQQLRAEPDLVGLSTDYSPTDVVHEPYTGNTIILNERNHTWFCIYKQMAFERSQVSHAFHREMLVGAPVERNCWDSCAYFQKSLRDQGLRFDHLHGKLWRDFIHYGAFSKNTSVTRQSVALFRAFALIEHSLPWRVSRHIRWARGLVLPRLENNRYQWVREAPIRW